MHPHLSLKNCVPIITFFYNFRVGIAVKKNLLFTSVFYGLLMAMLMPFDAHAMSLNEALSAAYDNSHRIKAQEAEVKSANENAPQALSEWLPTIQGNYSKGKKKIEFSSTESDGDTESKSISLNQPLFNGGGSVARMRQADMRILAAQERLNAVEQEVLLEAAIAYLDVVRDVELVEISRTNVQVLEKHLSATSERFRLGEITKTDVSQSKARLALAQAELAAAEGQLASSRAAFYRTVGREPDASGLPEQELSLPPLNLPALLEKAQQQHPTILAAEYDMLDAEREISIQKAELLPDVSFNAVHSEEESVFAFSSGATESVNQTYTVDVSVPFYRGGAQYSRVRQATHSQQVLAENYRQQQEVVRENVVRSFHELQAARASIVSTQLAVEAAEVALDGVRKEANVGARTTLDVLDAEQEYYQAQQELVSDQRDAIVGAYQLLSSIGELDSKRLGLDVERMFDPKAYREKKQYQIIGF